MQATRDLDEAATNWFNDKRPEQWSKCHFKEAPKCDMLLNNSCESFNAKNLEARDKPIITMLEWIWQFIMTRLQESRDKAEKRWKDKLCLRIKKIVRRHVEKVGDCIPIKCDNRHYQIFCYDGSQYCVDLQERTCTCRRWNLSGIPCKHAVTAIFNEGQMPLDYVHEYYTVECYNKIYEHAILGTNGQAEWAQTLFIPPLPPNFGRGVGRPAKARRREPVEPTNKNKQKQRGRKPNKMKRQQVTVRCRKCGVEGHNAKTCDLGGPKNLGDQVDLANLIENQPVEIGDASDQVNLTDLIANQPGGSENASDQVGSHTGGKNASKRYASTEPSSTENIAPRSKTQKTSKKKSNHAVPHAAPDSATSSAPPTPTIFPPLLNSIQDDETTMSMPTQVSLGESQDIVSGLENRQYVPGPSMWNQLHVGIGSQPLQPRIRIRAPPPMMDINLAGRFSYRSSDSAAPKCIVLENGKKFLDLSQPSQSSGKNQKNDGKK